MTPEREKAIDRMAKFLEELTERLGKLDQPGDDDDKVSPAGAAKRVASVVLEAESDA